MQRIILWGGIAGTMACLVHPNFVSITPDYGYYDSDGCYEVVLQGNNLGTKASATIGGAEIVNLAAAENDPALPEQAQDVGFRYSGFAPAGEPGWSEVTLTVDGEKLTLKDGWYYRTCPASVWVDTITLPGGTASSTTATPAPAAVGDPISFEGCGLDDDVTIEILDPTGVVGALTATAPPTATNTLCDAGTVAATIPLTVDCPAAQAHVDIPELPAGSYTVRLVHSDGTVDVGPCGTDSGDTGISCDCYAFDLGGAK